MLEPIEGKIPELMHFMDITNDKEYYINREVVYFYKLEGIELNSNPGNEK